MKIKFTVDTNNVSGYKILDMDIDVSKVYRPSDVVGYTAIKCDDEYFIIPVGEDDLAVIAVDANQISEGQALGLQRMMEKYISPDFEIKVG